MSIPVGAVEDLTPGEGRAYVVDGKQVAVFLLGDGTVRAMDAVCPHKGGPLADGQIDGSVVMCPLHQYTFSLDTGVCPSGIDSVRTYPAAVVDGKVTVDV
ncbi:MULTISPECIES: Rieske (2Fe-2S) protein [Nocardiaceae]|jgi:nitrite reductase/ring-hydroxylating ferredoxin subunit|uniref:Rieske (2Fe-2S) protein n=1 Tax=Nocardiaceae TaxID=85025 RepID=UPI00035FAE59|nr:MULTISPECIES: nitrite reductase (NAD(P)H) small subunit [Rhodococcus]OZC46202.1 2Fe-2S ferredoxin [Rhodococcus sp. RS1C4]OZC53854.1 2Fe-2S ferredoxin [Rhodococcus sp. 06-621-2]OZC89253.1 2Fe-2S ferredoxin [Rhodococcus sp. 06-418-1B]OZD05434.1 2Fe-2S ferredoxin [Rhodococcus sp. 06-156-4C]OZD16546.1 2Fe-2S ferredoxin [Rhodococcus sp. 06-156-4a]